MLFQLIQGNKYCSKSDLIHNRSESLILSNFSQLTEVIDNEQYVEEYFEEYIEECDEMIFWKGG